MADTMLRCAVLIEVSERLLLGISEGRLRHAVTADKVSGHVKVLEDATSAAGAGGRSSTACLAAIDGVHSHYLL